jgi:hypothetical protein
MVLLLLLLLAICALLGASQVVSAPTASSMPHPVDRALSTKLSFEWVADPHAAEACGKDPACTNHVKYGFTLVPMNVSQSVDVVFQSVDRPAGLSAVVNLETYTQPGCVMSGCHTTRVLGVLPQEECFNVQVRKTADQPDDRTARIDFGGIYYEHLPEGELYVKFERRNYLTDARTCAFEVRSGFKRWF